MKTTKRMFPHFQYRECDAFTKYLEQQSEKGWHFKEWRFGLVFEKGEQRKVKYSVEVFPKGNERDSRPEKDAEEFAEYCKAAGWELVDGQRKFCIFKAIRKDAVPIATPEERYENVCKAERERVYLPLVWILTLALTIWMAWGDISGWGFQMASLLFIIAAAGIGVLSVIDGAAAIIWRRNRKKMLVSGEVPAYGRSIALNYRIAECIMILCALAGRLMGDGIFSHGVIRDVMFVFSIILLMVILGIMTAFLRPSIERRIQAEWVSMAVLIIVCVCMILISPDEEPVFVSKENVPLLQEDFKAVEGDVFISGKQTESSLGRHCDYYITYGDKGVQPEEMQYDVYISKYNRVIERLWEVRDGWGNIRRKEPNEEGEMEDVNFTDCTELWGSEEAWVSRPRFYIEKKGHETRIEKYCYEVRYPQGVMVIYTVEGLDAEDTQIIREKLGLK